MSKLSAFLHPAAEGQEKEVVISSRFLDEEGKPVPFKIRAISQEENDRLIRAATLRKSKGGESEMDKLKYARSVVVAATVFPDFREKELCDHYGVMDPEQAVGRMLLAGEYNRLMEAIMELSGVGDDAQAEAKN